MTASLAARTLGQPDRVLVDRAAAGDHEAFDRLVSPRVASAFRLALAILRSEADARDAVQDAFVSAWQDLPRLRDREQFDAWLGRILVNRCRTMLRHRKVVKLREIPLETGNDPGRDRFDGGPPPRPEPRVEGGQANVAEADAVRRAFDRLDPDARVLIVLHHVEERPVAEIAALAGVPEGTVKWRLHAARKALERALERERR